MNPNKQTNSSWLSTLLMIGIMAFGGSAAFFVLSGGPDTPKNKVSAALPAAETPAQAPAEPEPAAKPVTAAPAAPTTTVATPAPVAVATPVAPVAPVAKEIEPKAAQKSLPVAEPKPRAAVKPNIKAQPAEAARRDKRARVVKEVAPAPVAREVDRGAREAVVVEQVSASEAKAHSASEPVVDFKPVPAAKHGAKDTGSEAKPANKTAEADPEKPVVKQLRAAPLVPAASKPVVVLTSGDKAWVRVDEQKTVVVSKGQELPGLGTYRGTDGKNAKFDSGVLPVTP